MPEHWRTLDHTVASAKAHDPLSPISGSLHPHVLPDRRFDPYAPSARVTVLRIEGMIAGR